MGAAAILRTWIARILPRPGRTREDAARASEALPRQDEECELHRRRIDRLLAGDDLFLS